MSKDHNPRRDENENEARQHEQVNRIQFARDRRFQDRENIGEKVFHVTSLTREISGRSL